jgi:hypothetical protein
MLVRLPGLLVKEIIAALENAGFEIERQKGRHVTLRNPEMKRTTEGADALDGTAALADEEDHQGRRTERR